LSPGPVRLPPQRSRRARARADGAAAALVSAGPRVGRAGRARQRGGPLPRRGGRERIRPGRLRDRVPARLRSRPAAPRPRRGARVADLRRPDRPRAGLDRSRAHGLRPHARAVRRAGAVGLSGRRPARRCEVRGARLPREDQGVSYTLRGRVDSRLAALLPVLLVACALAAALHRWWPVELVALMGGVGLALDVELYDRVVEYQPGWLA